MANLLLNQLHLKPDHRKQGLQDTIQETKYACHPSKSLQFQPRCIESSGNFDYSLRRSSSCPNIEVVLQTNTNVQTSDMCLNSLFNDMDNEEERRISADKAQNTSTAFESSETCGEGFRIESQANPESTTIPTVGEIGRNLEGSVMNEDAETDPPVQVIIKRIILLSQHLRSLSNLPVLHISDDFKTKQREILIEYRLLFHREKMRLSAILRKNCEAKTCQKEMAPQVQCPVKPIGESVVGKSGRSYDIDSTVNPQQIETELQVESPVQNRQSVFGTSGRSYDIDTTVNPQPVETVPQVESPMKPIIESVFSTSGKSYDINTIVNPQPVETMPQVESPVKPIRQSVLGTSGRSYDIDTTVNHPQPVETVPQIESPVKPIRQSVFGTSGRSHDINTIVNPQPIETVPQVERPMKPITESVFGTSGKSYDINTIVNSQPVETIPQVGSPVKPIRQNAFGTSGRSYGINTIVNHQPVETVPHVQSRIKPIRMSVVGKSTRPYWNHSIGNTQPIKTISQFKCPAKSIRGTAVDKNVRLYDIHSKVNRKPINTIPKVKSPVKPIRASVVSKSGRSYGTRSLQNTKPIGTISQAKYPVKPVTESGVDRNVISYDNTITVEPQPTDICLQVQSPVKLITESVFGTSDRSYDINTILKTETIPQVQSPVKPIRDNVADKSGTSYGTNTAVLPGNRNPSKETGVFNSSRFSVASLKEGRQSTDEDRINKIRLELETRVTRNTRTCRRNPSYCRAIARSPSLLDYELEQTSARLAALNEEKFLDDLGSEDMLIQRERTKVVKKEKGPKNTAFKKMVVETEFAVKAGQGSKGKGSKSPKRQKKSAGRGGYKSTEGRPKRRKGFFSSLCPGGRAERTPPMNVCEACKIKLDAYDSYQ